jgi:SAM-dependent methyltransferase
VSRDNLAGMRTGRRTRYATAHDLDRWKTDKRIAERGFAHRWDSVVADGNGEDFFLELLGRHLTAESEVLDVGCGHGDLALSMARQARSVIGIERDPGLIALAGELLAESGLTNVCFVQSELAGPDEDHRGGPLPLAAGCIDLVVDRRGPTLDRYLADVLRVGRPGTVILGMHAAGNAPPPPWAPSVPSLAGLFFSFGYDEMASWVTRPLLTHGITDYRLWWLDVPEYLLSARSLHDRLANAPGGPPVPPWQSVAAEIEAAFAANEVDGAVLLRHIRLVWEAHLPRR